MKKIFVALVCMMTLGVVAVNAQSPNPIELEVRFTNNTPLDPGGKKTPIQIPSVWLDDHTLTFDACHDGYTLNIVSGDVVVYTVYVPANTTEVVLPAYLSGTFELQLIQGNLCFYGEIDL